MDIRHSTDKDFERIMEIYEHARMFMAEHGNPNQWGPTQYQAVAQKTLAATFSQLADKPLPDALAEKIGQLHLPISPEQLSLAEGIHLMAYYGEYPLEYAPAKRNDRQVSPAKAAQLKELLSLKGKQINIPVEQLKRQDADQLFTNLLLSEIAPDTINKINEQEWENSLWLDMIWQTLAMPYPISAKGLKQSKRPEKPKENWRMNTRRSCRHAAI